MTAHASAGLHNIDLSMNYQQSPIFRYNPREWPAHGERIPPLQHIPNTGCEICRWPLLAIFVTWCLYVSSMLPCRALLSSQDVSWVAAFNHTTILYVSETEIVVCNSMLLVH